MSKSDQISSPVVVGERHRPKTLAEAVELARAARRAYREAEETVAAARQQRDQVQQAREPQDEVVRQALADAADRLSEACTEAGVRYRLAERDVNRLLEEEEAA